MKPLTLKGCGTGFICCDSSGRVCTLGRGGSDYSAALYAAALQADSLQIWTDVPGIMTANPKQVPAARTIPGMSYRAALEMAEHGAKVLYAPTVAPAMEAGIDIEIRNTFAPAGRFTRISAQPDAAPWIGVASQGGEICLVGTSEADLTGTIDTVQETLRTAGIAPLSVRVDGLNLLVRVREAIELPALQALHEQDARRRGILGEGDDQDVLPGHEPREAVVGHPQIGGRRRASGHNHTVAVCIHKRFMWL